MIHHPVIMGAARKSLHVMVCIRRQDFTVNEMFNKDASRIMKSAQAGKTNTYCYNAIRRK